MGVGIASFAAGLDGAVSFDAGASDGLTDADVEIDHGVDADADADADGKVLK